MCTHGCFIDWEKKAYLEGVYDAIQNFKSIGNVEKEAISSVLRKLSE